MNLEQRSFVILEFPSVGNFSQAAGINYYLSGPWPVFLIGQFHGASRHRKVEEAGGLGGILV